MIATPISTSPNGLTQDLFQGETIRWAQAGDHTAFEAIFTQYQTQIYNYIYRLMGSAEDAYDLTQDTFLKAYLALPKTSDDLRVGAWLYRIATNVCLDELRHRKLVKWQPWEAFISVFHPSQVAKDSPERDCIDRENTEEVQRILDRLHPKYRMCLILREYHDLSYHEIAEALSTTRAAVRSLLSRAREAFRDLAPVALSADYRAGRHETGSLAQRHTCLVCGGPLTHRRNQNCSLRCRMVWQQRRRQARGRGDPEIDSPRVGEVPS